MGCLPGYVSVTNSDGYDDCIPWGTLTGGSTASGGVTGGGTSIPAPATTASSDSGDISGWLSGLGGLFAGIGTGISTGYKAVNAPGFPASGGFTYNPTTGQYVNAQGQIVTSTGVLPSAAGLTGLLNNPVVLIGGGLLLFLLLRKR